MATVAMMAAVGFVLLWVSAFASVLLKHAA
jgi:predicted histidine transporter YuiF (NhaC family)